jgi:hypothetical protein
MVLTAIGEALEVVVAVLPPASLRIDVASLLSNADWSGTFAVLQWRSL